MGLGELDRDPRPQDEHGDLTGTVVKGASVSAIGYALAQAMNLAAYAVLARLLAPSDFGIYAAATILLGFALLVTESGFASAVIHRRDQVEAAAVTAAVATFANGIALGLVALAAAPILGFFFDSTTIAEVAAVTAGIVTLRSLTIAPDAVMQRRFSFLRRTVIEPIQVIVFATASIVAASNDMGVWSLVIGQYAAAASDVILCWTFARWRPRLRLASVALWRELVAYGRHVFTATVILQAGQQADAIIVGRLLGTAPLGQFRYGYRLASTPFQALLAAAAYVLFPAFARIAHDEERLRGAFLRSLRFTCMLAMPMGLILVPLGVPLAVIAFGDIWRDAGIAAIAMAAFTSAGMVISVVSESVKAIGRPDRLTPMHTVTTALTATLMLAAVPIGFEAVAAAVSIGALGGAAYALRTAADVLGIPVSVSLRQIIPSLAAAGVMVAAIVPLELVLDAESHATLPSFMILGGEVLAAGAVFLLALRLISKDAFGELREAAGLLAGRVAPLLSRKREPTSPST